MPRMKISYLTKGYEGEKKSLEISAEPYEFILTTRGCWENVIADEDVFVQKGEIKSIRIKPLQLKPEEIVISCPIMRNALGCILSVGGEGPPRRVEKPRRFTFALFAAYREGEIQKNELLGVVNILSTAVSISALARTLLNIRYFVTHFTKPPQKPRGST